MQELRYVLSNLPVKVSEEEINAMLEAGDTDKDGKISLQEFTEMIGNKWEEIQFHQLSQYQFPCIMCFI